MADIVATSDTIVVEVVSVTSVNCAAVLRPVAGRDAGLQGPASTPINPRIRATPTTLRLPIMQVSDLDDLEVQKCGNDDANEICGTVIKVSKERG
jgi:hypothetical protein